MGLNIDQEFRSVIPPLLNDERAELEKSILAEGCRDAIVLWGDTIVDGHNRYEICCQHEIPFRMVKIQFNSRDEAIVWIIRNQLARRNLEPAARIEVVSRFKKVIARQAKERQRAAGGDHGNQYTSGKPNEMAIMPILAQVPETQTSRDTLADMAGVSHGTYDKAIQVYEEAPETIKNAMRNGVISIDAAHKVTKAAEKDPEVKRKLENKLPEQVIEAILRDGAETERRIKRYSKIIDTWFLMATLNYTEDDYDIWLSNADDDFIDRQLENTKKAIRNITNIQSQLVEKCKERRWLKLVN